MRSLTELDVVSDFFWLVATLDLAMSLGLDWRIRHSESREPTDEHLALRRGLRQDSWLACALIWTVLLSEGCPIRPALTLIGSMTLVWLLKRAVRRIRSLKRSP